MRQRFMDLPASVLVPALGSPVLPPCCLAGTSANSHGSVSLSASTSPPWSPKTARAGLHVANVRELKLEVDSVGLALGLGLRDLAAQLFGGFGVLRRLCHLRLERSDLLVSLCDGLLLVLAAHLRLVLRRLLLPEVFLGLRLFLRLVAMVVTGHVSHFSYRGRHKQIGPLTLRTG